MGKKIEQIYAYMTDINFDVEKYSKDKRVIADTTGRLTLDKLQSMFRINGLPETMPQKWVKLQLMKNGFTFVTDKPGAMYAFYGGLGGEPDPYYQPTICTVANPALNFSDNLRIGVDGVLISNDTLRLGVVPLVGKYAGLLAENTITMRIADIMARITAILSASDESTIESAKEFLRQIEEGKLGVIEENPFLSDMKLQTGASQATNTRLTDLIEMEQYLKASMLNELGIQANYNMKRESINSQEAQLGDDALQPFIDNMLECWKEGFDEVNKMYGTNITVEFNSAWAENDKTRDVELDILEKEADDEQNSGESNNQGDLPTDGDTDKPEEQEDE